MSRSTLLHRDLSRRIESLKQIVDAKLPSPLGETYAIDLNPNTSQLTLKCTRKQRQPPHAKSQQSKSLPPNPLNSQLDEGFESDVDTISLMSTESTMSKSQETDSANGSSDSDDCHDATSTTKQDTDEVTEHFNLVNCVCYTDDKHPNVLILVANEETLVFRFDNSQEVETFHANFSTVKAVASQKSYSATNQTQSHFNLLQRTDANGMTHIRIAGNETKDEHVTQPPPMAHFSYDDNEEFASIMSLPNFPADGPQSMPPQLASNTLKPFKKRSTFALHLKKSKSIEDLLSDEKPLKKVWNSAENLLDTNTFIRTKPKVPLRRKKGPAPQPPPQIVQTNNLNLSKSFTNLNLDYSENNLGSLGNVFQGQFVRVQVDHGHNLAKYTNFPTPNLKCFKTGPEILKYETYKSTSKNQPKVRNFDAFKFSDPKNITGYSVAHGKQAQAPEKAHKPKSTGFSFGFNLGLYIPMYKSNKNKANGTQTNPHHNSTSTSTFTNRFFGMSSKLKEFSSLQSGCNPNRRYETNPHQPQQQQQHFHRNFNFEVNKRMGRLGRSGSLGNLTLLANAEKANYSSHSNTLKSVIKKRNLNDDMLMEKSGRKKVTFSAYNTVQVV